MEPNKRVYPAERTGSRLLKKLLLLAAAALLLSGLWNRGQELTVEPAPQATPIPLDEGFDETPAQQDITLPGIQWYALQLGAFESRESAQTFAQQYAKRGAAGFIWADGRYRVLAAAYPTREDAQQVRQQLSTQHQVDCYVYEISLPAVQLRMKGMQGQLDIWQAAFLHAGDLAAQVQAISMAMDRQEMNVTEASEQLKNLDLPLQEVCLRLRQRFTVPMHPAVSGLIDLFEQYAAFYPQISGQSAAEAGRLLKEENLDVLWRLKQIYALFDET